MERVDILMITYNRPTYTARSLPRLLQSCEHATEAGFDARVWVWHNGADADTRAIVREHQNHPRMQHMELSDENRLLREPTNWFWRKSEAQLLGKVDDDILIAEEWIPKLARAHAAEPRLGLCGAWQFLEEDYRPELAERKIRTIGGDTRIMANPWLGGSGYLMKRQVLSDTGPLREEESFSNWCIRAALRGWLIGWLYPFVQQEDMDDPRHPLSLRKSDADVADHASLSQRRYGVTSLNEVLHRQKRAAYEVQAASPNARDYVGVRGKVRRAIQRARGTGRVARFNP